MKSLFLIPVLLLLSYMSFGQAENIKVVNFSSCPVYVSLRLSEPANPCVQAYESNVFIVPPFTSQTYDYTNYPGSTATSPLYFLYAKVFQGPLDCSGMGDAIGVGETCYAFPQSGWIQAHDFNCAICDDVQAIWTPQANPSGYAVLEFQP